jgi:hypothetical protein
VVFLMRQEGGQTGRGKGKETNREGEKIERGQREGRKGRKGGGKGGQTRGGRQAVGPHSLFVGGGGPSLSVGTRCLQARIGSFSSVGGCCVCGWASRWGSFSLVGGCCVCGCSRSGVGVALGVVLVGGGLLRLRAIAFVGGGCCHQWGLLHRGRSCSRVGVAFGVLLIGGVLLWGGFVVLGAFCFPAAGVVRGWSSFVGGGRSSGVDDGGGVVLARSGCDMALPRRCRPSLCRPVLSSSFWFSLTIVVSRRRSALILVGDVALARHVAASSFDSCSRTCWGVPWLWLVVDGHCGQCCGGVAVVEGAGVGKDGAVGG